ncbi:hypothetical protein AK812_SmicGene43146 [Symbiodinium microadriaticum]|uniref:Uncharacterized protein n=1 Tax=Symbiodinium microadriaticum TaxID=2951 RepID=A0A1Q9C1S5_SYMMI|nr:hypothetical protein AK812_SmicGene43146 [Symbiodinium microadriaticum]
MSHPAARLEWKFSVFRVFLPEAVLVMGASASDLDRTSLAKVSWSLTQHESNNPWCNYLMSRYGVLVADAA